MAAVRRVAPVWVWLGVCCVLGLCVAGRAQAADWSRLAKKVSPAVVTLVTFDAAGAQMGQGTGFFVNRHGDVLTNLHVLEGVHHARLITSTGKTANLTGLKGLDESRDIALAATDVSATVWLKVARKPPDPGEPVVVVGSPRGYAHTVSDGIVSALRQLPGVGQVVQITAPISPGSSGSPVLNRRADVLGVATLVQEGGQNLNFAIPLVNLPRRDGAVAGALAPWPGQSRPGAADTADGLYQQGISLLPEQLVPTTDKNRKRAALARPFFEAALKKDPAHVAALIQLGRCLVFAQDFAGAAALFGRAAALAPKNPRVFFSWAMALQGLGQNDEAFEKLKTTAALDPAHGWAFYHLANHFLSRELYAESLAALQSALAHRPDTLFPAVIHLMFCKSLLGLNRLAEAGENCQRAAELEPTSAVPVHHLAVVWLAQGKRAEALKTLTRLMEWDTALAADLSKRLFPPVVVGE